MSVERKDEEAIFKAAIKLKTSAERAKYLKEVCGDNADLLKRLEILLKAHDESGDFLEVPPFDANVTLDDSPLSEGPGTVIGQYKLLEKIGEGGMAVVYMAEQKKPIRRKVALKIIKLGMDTKSVIARFEVERQALALMDHPNIAKVHDAGATETGRPYFVMELVKGVSITEYCDKNESSTKERLDLFISVCNAVQHAHQKGIMHRDIKPSNVMVTLHDGEPMAKVIDFGIAKATNQQLTERTLFTRYAQMIGTPVYMSPEQAEMSALDIDTRTDIYSLGVLMYELLTGTTPFDAEKLREAGYGEIQRIIREEEPPKPSTRLSTMGEELTIVAKHRHSSPDLLTKLVRGDLDWIVMKSLEKNRTWRYATATELVADITRHLNNEPVLAGPPSQIYRLRKFMRRHRTQAIGTATVAVLLAGIAVISSMYIRALNRGEEAESLKHKDILSNAMEFRSKGQFHDALSKVEAMLSSKHVGPEARLLRARLILELQGPTDTVKELQKLLHERDDIACQAHFLLARIYLESVSGVPEKTQEYQQKAKEHQQKGEKLFSESAEAYFNRSMMAGTVDKTLGWLNKAVDFEAGHYPSRKARALGYYALRDYRSMERDAVAMTVLRDWDSLGYSLLGIALRETDYFVDAIKYHNKAVTISPDEAELYDQRRQTHMKMANYEQAILDARRCIELEPEKSIYHFHAFCALVALGRYNEATAEYDTIIESGMMSKERFELSAVKYISDALDAGLLWHPSQHSPKGAAFLAMQESAEIYHQLAKKGKRVVSEGFHPNWSPDGTELVYSRGIIGFACIEILNLELGKTRLLTVPGFDPAWSPDGRHIAFTRYRQALLLTDLTVDRVAKLPPFEEREIWLIKTDGTEEPELLAKGHWPCWSRDSKRVFYYSPQDNMVCSISIEDRFEQTPIIRCPTWYPVVSPDEKYFAYGQQGSERKIVELSTNSVFASWKVPLITGFGYPNWSPSGQELSMADYENSGLWIYELDKKKASKVLSGRFSWCSWSQPDISKIAIERVCGYLNHEIWVANLDPNMSTAESLGPGRTVEEHCQEMVDHYTRRINFEPEEAGHYLSRAECYVYLDDQEKAFADLEKYAGIVKDPEKMGQIYADMVSSLLLSTGGRSEPVIAVSLAKKAIEKAPENWAYHSTLGEAQYYAGEYEDSISTLEHADKMYADKWNRSYPRNFAFIAMSLHQLGRRQQAEAALAKLRQMFENGRNKELRKYLFETEQLFAGKDSKIGVAWNFVEAKRLDKALELLIELSALSVEDDPDFPARIQSVRRYLLWEYFQRGSTNERKREYDEAVANYESAVKTDPGHALTYNALAGLLATCPEDEFRNGTKAIENATKACELTNWDNAQYVDTLAAAYAEAGDFDEAIKWQQKAIDLLPKEKRSRKQLVFEAKLKLYQSGRTYHRQHLFARQMIAWWKFDQVENRSVLDSSGNSLHGKLVGDAHIVSDPDRGSVLCLDGNGDYVDCGNNWIFDFTDKITVAAWIKFKAFDKEWQAIVTKGESAWRLSTVKSERKFHFAVTDWNVSENWVDGNISTPTGEWHHVCGTYDGANIRLYVDGVEDSNSPVPYSGIITTNSYNVNIGENTQANGRYWSGLIDDVRIYNYSLSEVEVKEIYAGHGPDSNERPE
jgi:serine/threonine protein kinase/Flp pilus assembly protein TadD